MLITTYTTSRIQIVESLQRLDLALRFLARGDECLIWRDKQLEVLKEIDAA